MQYWKQEDDGSFRRVDGAVVKADSSNPERPWTANGPGNQLLSVIILCKPSARTWRSATHAMAAVDQHFPMKVSETSSPDAPPEHEIRRKAEVLLRDRLISRARALAQTFELHRPSLISD